MTNDEIGVSIGRMFEAKAHQDRLTSMLNTNNITNGEYSAQMKRNEDVVMNEAARLVVTVLCNLNTIARSLEEIAKSTRPEPMLKTPDDQATT